MAQGGEQYSDEWYEIRELAKTDLNFFAKLFHPQYQYGDIHKEVFEFLSESSTPNDLLLLPRAHLKSHCLAVWAEQKITADPTTTILYVSATTTLAEAQLGAIKNTLTTETYQFYFPEMVNQEEGKREKWTNDRICIDHPDRSKEGVRDDTIRAVGLTTTITGLHAEVILADDVVEPNNAYTEDGRKKVAASMSQLASILNAGGVIKACGTRYHPNDQYALWEDQVVPVYDDNDEYAGEESIWNIMTRVVETNGKFLWERTARPDGKLFGFNRQELNRISAMYTDRVQFFAQYYQNPNEAGSNRINRETFQYYDPKYLTQEGGDWYYKGDKLALFAAMDFAYSMSSAADYSAIVVIGVNSSGDIFVLALDRFRTDRISEYYNHVLELHNYWGFRKLKAEVSLAQKIIVNDLKDKITKDGGLIKIDEHRPMKAQGSKEERIAAALEYRYENLSIYHMKGGLTPVLEEELILARPRNDDLKDTLAIAVEYSKPPYRRAARSSASKATTQYNSRFGGAS